MRIAIGQLWQETNTFNPLPTTRADFEQFGVCRGAELVKTMAETNELGGFIQSLRQWPEAPEIMGLVRLPAWPAGPATQETFAWLQEEILQALNQALPIDGLLLALHGALVAEGTPDVEGAILGPVRRRIGPEIPLVATLDLHANVTARMVKAADALVLYHTAPHIDVFETGQRAATVLRRILVDGARPVTAFQKIPAVFPAERANTQDKASISQTFKQRLLDLETNPKILCAGLGTVQPWLDIPELGTAALVVSDRDEQLAISECRGLATEVWQHRTDYLPQLIPVKEAVRLAHENDDGLVVLSDSADATTSGAPGDSNWVLRELLQYNWRRPALVTLVDPQVVTEVKRLGIGATWSGPLGGKRDKRFCQPIPVEAKATGLFDARFILSGHLAKNMPIDMGASAILRVGNVHVVLTSRAGPHFAPQLFQAAGLDPFGAAVLVAKSPCGFRAAYEGRAKKIIVVKAPGCAPSDFWNYEYQNIPRPMWPWDEIKEWSPK
ncbi:MAG: M81 family metallopeptidase [Gemmataceae bacterium]